MWTVFGIRSMRSEQQWRCGQFVDADGPARRCESSCDQKLQNRPIIFRHDPRRAHHAARIAVHDFIGLLEWVRARSTIGAQTFGSAGSRMTLDGSAEVMPACSRNSRGRTSGRCGIFIDIAQDIGQLQRASQMMGEQDAVVPRQAEHPHRQASDRAGDAVAIQIQHCQIRRPDVLRHVHLHAIDDGQEILALEIKSSNRRDIVPQSRRRMALIERIDIVAPLLKRGQPFGRGPSESAISSTCRQKL